MIGAKWKIIQQVRGKKVPRFVFVHVRGILFRTRKLVAGFKWRHDVILLRFERSLGCWLAEAEADKVGLLWDFRLELVVIWSRAVVVVKGHESGQTKHILKMDNGFVDGLD